MIAPIVRAILENNKNLHLDEIKIPITSVMVEDGIVSPIHQRLSIKDIAFASGLVTPDLLPEYEILEQKCEAAMQKSPQTAFNQCKQMVSFMSDTNGGWSLKDIRYEAGKEPLRNEELLDSYFQNKTVQRQLHILQNGETIPFTNFNGTVYSRLKLDGAVDYSGTYNDIVNSGIPLMVISGSLDGQDGITGTDRWVMSLNITRQTKNINLIKKLYYYKLDSNIDNLVCTSSFPNCISKGEETEKVGGTFTIFKNNNLTLSLVHVYSAGHILGSTQIHISKSLFLDLISSKEPRCHKSSGNWEIKDKVWEYMNSCNNRGTCEEGKCKCNSGSAYGADWSIVPQMIENTSITLFPREWKYYKIDRNTSIIIDLKSINGSEIHIYHSVGAAPTRLNHDGFKKSDSMRYLIDEAGKYTVVAIHNPSLTDDVPVQIKYEVIKSTTKILDSE